MITTNKANSTTRTFSKRKRIKRVCDFDSKDNLSLLNYMNVRLLASYLNDCGFIKRRARTGVCSKHQRYLRKMIIRARHLHLLPYISY